MKIIHCADVHLGSKIEAKLPPEKAAIRRKEVRMAFTKMVDFAKAGGVRAILLAGDVFDSDMPFRKDKEFFYSQVKSNPDIDFLYLRGNHDCGTAYEEKPLNLLTFGAEWAEADYGGIAISGIESSDENCASMYGELSLDPDKINIVMLHGEISDSPKKNGIVLKLLKDKNIDYLALGHIHKFGAGPLPERGMYCYSGCLEGRGFDETGAKGFVLLDIDEETRKINTSFVENSIRKTEEYDVDVTGAVDAFDAAVRVKNAVTAPESGIVRVNIIGGVSFDTDGLADAVQESLEPYFFYVSVKNMTEELVDYSEIAKEKTLRGEFVRVVTGDASLDDDTKRDVLKTGLRALAGKGTES